MAKQRLLAWTADHDNRKAVFDSLVLLPEGASPDGKGWQRAPWLDEPAGSDKPSRKSPSYELGLVDGRVEADALLREARRTILALIPSGGAAAESEYEIANRIQAYRKATRAAFEAQRKRGWYRKEKR